MPIVDVRRLAGEDLDRPTKYCVARYMALSVSIDFRFATEDIFATDEEIEDTLSSIRLGMRYYV